MKVQWEDTDVRRGRRVWRDMECVIAGADDYATGGLVAIIVVETARIMMTGTTQTAAEYLTKWEYRPVKDR